MVMGAERVAVVERGVCECDADVVAVLVRVLEIVGDDESDGVRVPLRERVGDSVALRCKDGYGGGPA